MTRTTPDEYWYNTPIDGGFKMVVRQFAINKEFDLGVEKSYKTIYRAYCKSEGDCPWRITTGKSASRHAFVVTYTKVVST